MTDEFTIQCESCGTHYNELQDVCPYCGTPQPLPTQETALPPNDPALMPEADLPEIQDNAPYDDDTAYEAPPDEPDLPVAAEASPPKNLPIPTHQLLGRLPVVADDPAPEPEPVPYDDALLPADPFANDDIFAVAGEEELVDDDAFYDDGILDEAHQNDEAHHFDENLYPETDYIDTYDDPDNVYDQDHNIYHQPVIDPYGAYIETDAPDGDYLDDEPVKAAKPHRFTFRRIFAGCLGLFICFILFYGGIGFVAVRQGLQERAQNTQTESQQHYQNGQDYLANNAIELAIAEFERALSLNPNFTEARQALREAQRIAQTQPTPTSQTRSAASAEFLAQAETHVSKQNWTEAAQSLLQVRGVDPDFEPERVSELMFTTYYQLGLEFIDAEQLPEAQAAFEQALAERPDDLDISVELSKISLYLDGTAAEKDNLEQAVELLSELYELDENYLDTGKRLWRSRELYGDELAQANQWCLAQTQYLEANLIQNSDTLDIKAQNAGRSCSGGSSSPTLTPTATRSSIAAQSTAVRPTEIPTDTAEEDTEETQTAGPVSGRIYHSTYNPNESRWEIVSIPASGGETEVVVTDATMPAVSPNGQLLLYHTELIDTEGLHILDLTSGEDKRITKITDHILPRWGGSNEKFLFTVQEAGTGRWLIQQGFADGKSEPFIVGDGRTPDWSENSSFIAFQGTDAEGNNPGIYLTPLTGGESTRITTHESDRSPAFSPDGSKLAYMSAVNGNWDIYVIGANGGTPRQLTTSPANDGLPTWSPDGTRLAYVSDTGGSWAIYTVDIFGGGSPVKVTEWDVSRREDWLTSQIWWSR